ICRKGGVLRMVGVIIVDAAALVSVSVPEDFEKGIVGIAPDDRRLREGQKAMIQTCVIPEVMNRSVWPLLHSLWAGAFIAAIAAGVLKLQTKKSAQSSYAATVSSIAAMLGRPIISFPQLDLDASRGSLNARIRRLFGWTAEATMAALFVLTVVTATAGQTRTVDAQEVRIDTSLGEPIPSASFHAASPVFTIASTLAATAQTIPPGP